MARIPLRAYNREIENLIERGQIEEAIAHCKNILKQFPKHIDTYRLLGKAFLESQRYTEAVDILQRVLSVYPDDFVSQLGMSIIREDEGNQDAAIWHMERAYEVQPFNRAVQDELRRLYGRRDGVEPPKIRLNRGSLVRMYARGELFPQAIAEARAALAEDPQRADLLVLLARMYYLSGQKVEAAEIASSLIARLPYCYEANRILQEILPTTSRADEAKSYQQRVYSLSPYMAFITPNSPTAEQVADQSVMVEKVDWQPSQQDQQGPEWARTIGVQWEQKEEEQLPDWLSTLKPQAAAPTSPQEEAGQESAGDVIPDWMKSAGWGQSTGAVQEGPSNIAEEDVEELPAEAVQTDIPEWLQAMAPPQQENAKDEKEGLDWLSSILPVSAAATEIAAKPETPTLETPDLPIPEAAALDQDQMPDWLQPTPAVDSTTEAELPDWMGVPAAQTTADENLDLDWLKPVEEKTADMPTEVPDWLSIPAAETEAVPTTETPDWLAQLKDEDTAAPVQEEVQPAEDLPAWLEEAAQAQPPVEAIAGLVEPDAGTVESSEWLRSLQSEGEVEPSPEPLAAFEPTDQAPTESEAQAPEDIDAALAWMEALAARQGADEASLQITSPEERSTETPEWLQQTPSTEVQEQAAEPVSDLPDWLTQAVPADSEPLAEAVTEPEEALAEAAEIPEWMQELQPVVDTPALDIVEASPETVEAAPAAELGEMPEDLDAAMAWMEALAARQGADEASLQITAPEQRSTETPEWLQQEPSAEVPEQVAEPVSDLPDWLTQSEPGIAESLTEPAAEPEEALAEAAEIPEWMQDLQPSVETPAMEIPQEGLPETAEAAPAAELGEMPEDLDAAMAWMEALAARQGADEASLQITAPEQRSTETPEWLQQETAAEETMPEAVQRDEAVWTSEAPEAELPPQAETLPAAPTIIAEIQPEVEAPAELPQALAAEMPEDLDAALAWMEALAARQGADEASLKISTPEERSAETPSWLSDLPKEPELDVEADAPTSPTRIQPPVLAEEPLSEAVPVVEEAESQVQTEDEDFAWLEALAARQGADETTLVTPAAEREETPPKWVTGELDASALETTQPEQEQQPTLPEWLRTYDEQPQTATEVSAAPVQPEGEVIPSATVEDLPEWLKGESSGQDEQVTTWLEGLEETVEEPAVASQPAEIASEWIQEQDFTAPAFTPAEPGSLLAQAQTALAGGNLNTALDCYTNLINEGASLEETIHDLRDALYRYPVDVSLWQTLGDAYIRNDQVQEALDAYTKAEELLR